MPTIFDPILGPFQLVMLFKDAIFNGMMRFFCELVKIYLAWCKEVTLTLGDLIPTKAHPSVEVFGRSLRDLNQWFPVTESLIAVSVMISVFVNVMAVRLIRRFLPF